MHHLLCSSKYSRIMENKIVLVCYMGLFIFLTTGCRQKFYILRNECSQALASFTFNRNCSRVDLLKSRPVCEVQSMDDFVALRRMVLAVGMKPVCYIVLHTCQYVTMKIANRKYLYSHFGVFQQINALKSIASSIHNRDAGLYMHVYTHIEVIVLRLSSSHCL